MGIRLDSPPRRGYDAPMTTTQKTILIITAIFALLIISSTYEDPAPAAKIGGTEVPALRCQEDEVIGFDMSGEMIPAPLMCIHIDDLRGTPPFLTEGVECDAFETNETICVEGNTGERVSPLSPDAAAQGREEDAYDMGYQDGLAAN